MDVQEGARWLREWCHKVQAGPGSADAAGGDDSLALAVSRVLLATCSADEAAAELFDLLGDASFDAIQQILEHRYESTTHHAAASVHTETFHRSCMCLARPVVTHELSVDFQNIAVVCAWHMQQCSSYRGTNNMLCTWISRCRIALCCT